MKPDLIASRRSAGPSQPSALRLSVVVAVCDQREAVAQAVDALLRTWLPCNMEVVVVDDGSSDGTWEMLRTISDPRLIAVRHPRRLGRGTALQTAAYVATGTHLVPFGTTMEYDPADLARLVEPVLAGRCDVVYGTRLFGANTSYQSLRHALGNRLLTLTGNLLYDACLSDLCSCLKLIPVSLVRELNPSEADSGFDAEVTAKLLMRGLVPFEVPISYHSRSIVQGKRLNWRGGWECLRVLAVLRLPQARRPVVDVDPHRAVCFTELHRGAGEADPLEHLEAELVSELQAAGLPA